MCLPNKNPYIVPIWRVFVGGFIKLNQYVSEIQLNPRGTGAIALWSAGAISPDLPGRKNNSIPIPPKRPDIFQIACHVPSDAAVHAERAGGQRRYDNTARPHLEHDGAVFVASEGATSSPKWIDARKKVLYHFGTPIL